LALDSPALRLCLIILSSSLADNVYMLERRNQERMLTGERVQVQWKDQLGQTLEVVANLEDISLSGACIQLDRPIPLRTALRLTYQKTELTGTVRHCVLREIGYVLGIEFDPGSQWSARNPRVQQEVHPRTRVSRTSNRL
jgi:hypothetical protein